MTDSDVVSAIEFAPRQVSMFVGKSSRNKAFFIQPARVNKNESGNNSSRDGVECWYCEKTGHINLECFKGNRDKSKDNADKNKNEEDKSLDTLTRSDKPPTEIVK